MCIRGYSRLVYFVREFADENKLPKGQCCRGVALRRVARLECSEYSRSAVRESQLGPAHPVARAVSAFARTHDSNDDALAH